MYFDIHTGGYLTSKGMSNTGGVQPACKRGHLHRADEWIHFEGTTGTISILFSDNDIVTFCDILMSLKKNATTYVKINEDVTFSVDYFTDKYINFDFGMDGAVFIFTIKKRLIKNLVQYLLLEVGR